MEGPALTPLQPLIGQELFIPGENRKHGRATRCFAFALQRFPKHTRPSLRQELRNVSGTVFATIIESVRVWSTLRHFLPLLNFEVLLLLLFCVFVQRSVAVFHFPAFRYKTDNFQVFVSITNAADGRHPHYGRNDGPPGAISAEEVDEGRFVHPDSRAMYQKCGSTVGNFCRYMPIYGPAIESYGPRFIFTLDLTQFLSKGIAYPDELEVEPIKENRNQYTHELRTTRFSITVLPMTTNTAISQNGFDASITSMSHGGAFGASLVRHQAGMSNPVRYGDDDVAQAREAPEGFTNTETVESRHVHPESKKLFSKCGGKLNFIRKIPIFGEPIECYGLKLVFTINTVEFFVKGLGNGFLATSFFNIQEEREAKREEPIYLQDFGDELALPVDEEEDAEDNRHNGARSQRENPSLSGFARVGDTDPGQDFIKSRRDKIKKKRLEESNRPRYGYPFFLFHCSPV
eukprot:gene6288-4524_t